MRQTIAAVTALTLFGHALHAQEKRLVDVGVDHIILAAGQLAHGTEEFTRLTGVTPRFGGQHPGAGTQNALVSLGAGMYVEVLAPVVDSKEEARPLVPAGWALHTRDLGAVMQRLTAHGFTLEGPRPGSRMTPDSTLLRWRTAGVSGPGLELAPFFIEWDPATSHPSTTSPPGCRLTAFELTAP